MHITSFLASIIAKHVGVAEASVCEMAFYELALSPLTSMALVDTLSLTFPNLPTSLLSDCKNLHELETFLCYAYPDIVNMQFATDFSDQIMGKYGGKVSLELTPVLREEPANAAPRASVSYLSYQNCPFEFSSLDAGSQFALQEEESRSMARRIYIYIVPNDQDYQNYYRRSEDIVIFTEQEQCLIKNQKQPLSIFNVERRQAFTLTLAEYGQEFVLINLCGLSGIQDFNQLVLLQLSFIQDLMNLGLRLQYVFSCEYQTEGLNSFGACLAGVYKGLHSELPSFKGCHLTIDTASASTDLEENILEIIQREANLPILNLIKNAYYVPELMPLNDAPSQSGLKKNGVYLLTGRLNLIGQTIARTIAENFSARVYVIDHHPLTLEQKAFLESYQGRIHYFNANISQASSLRELYRRLKSESVIVNGIIHRASETQANYFKQKDLAVFQPKNSLKIAGALNLDHIYTDEPLDFFIVFSTMDTLLGNRGITDGIAANSWLDRFTQQRNKLLKIGARKGITQCLYWPVIEKNDHDLDAADKEWLEQTWGLQPIALSQIPEVLKHALDQNASHIIPFIGDISRLLHYYQTHYTCERSLIDTANTLTVSLPEDKQSENWQANTFESSKSEAAQSIKIPPLHFVTSAQDPDPIVIVGMDGAFANADNLEQFWQKLVDGESLMSDVLSARWPDGRITNNSHNQPIPRVAGLLNNLKIFDAGFFDIGEQEANMLDPQQRLFLQTAWRSIENAGESPIYLKGKSIGVFVAAQQNDYIQSLYEKNQRNDYVFSGNLLAWLANRLSHLLDLTGPSETISAAGSGALLAINRAIQSIKHGECESAIVGAVHSFTHLDSYLCAAEVGNLSHTGKCAAFDRTADGILLGEGVGALWLMPLSLAKRRAYPILALIKGIGINHSGYDNSLILPSSESQKQLLLSLYEKMQIPMNTLSHIEMHGEGNLVSDVAEMDALVTSYKMLSNTSGRHQTPCTLGTVKPNVGHLQSAAAMASIIKVLLMFQHNHKPANLNFHQVNPYIKLDDTPFCIQQKNENWSEGVSDANSKVARRAAVSAFGIGGTNAHLILEAYPKQQRTLPVTLNPYYLCCLSAKTTEALYAQVNELYYFLLSQPHLALLDIASTLSLGRSHYDKRCAIMACDLTMLIDGLRTMLDKKESPFLFLGLQEEEVILSPMYYELLEFLQLEINRNKEMPSQYLKKLSGIADLYTKGLLIDWHRLLDIKTPRRIHLPGYAFEKKTYWYKSETKQSKLQQPSHLLKDNLSTLDEFRLAFDLTVKDAFTDAYRVGDEEHIHDAFLFELIQAGVDYLFPKHGTLHLSQLQWLIPIKYAALNNDLIFVLVKTETGLTFQFRLENMLLADGEIYFQSVMNVVSNISMLDISDLANQSARQISQEEIYGRFSAQGIHYGSSYQAIQKCYHNNDFMLAEIKLTDSLALDSDWLIHPSIMVALYQGAIVFSHSDDKNDLRSLLGVMGMRYLQSPPPKKRYFAHFYHNKYQQAAVRLYDETGTLYLSIDGLISQDEPIAQQNKTELTEQKTISAFRKVEAVSKSQSHTKSHNPGLKIINAKQDALMMEPERHYGVPSSIQTQISPVNASVTDSKQTGVNDLSLKVSDKKVEHLNANIPDKTIKNQPVENLSEQNTLAEDIAVIGFHGRFPNANTLEEYWDLLSNKRSAIVSSKQEGDDASCIGAFIPYPDSFDAEFFGLSYEEALKLPPEVRLLLETCWGLFENAGYTDKQLDAIDREVGVFVGSDTAEVMPIANRVSRHFNLVGPALNINTASASALTAIHMACESLKQADCEVAIAAAIHLIPHPTAYQFLEPVSLHHVDHLKGILIPGEGLGGVILKPLNKALRDQDHVYAVIKATRLNNSGKAVFDLGNDFSAQENLIEKTLRKASLTPEDISYLEILTPAISSPESLELYALKKIYGHRSKVVLGNLTENIGYLGAAAGMAGIIKILLQMSYQKVLPTLSGEIVNQQHRSIFTANFQFYGRLMPWAIDEEGQSRCAAISAFEADRGNVHVVLTESTLPHVALNSAKDFYIFPLSAKSHSSLILYLHELISYLNTHKYLSLEALSYTLSVRREHFAYRCAIVASSVNHLLSSLKELLSENRPDNVLCSDGRVGENKSPLYNEIHNTILSQFKLEAPLSSELLFEKLTFLADLYTKGYRVDWEKIFDNTELKPIRLPNYIFTKTDLAELPQVPLAGLNSDIPPHYPAPPANQLRQAVENAKQGNIILQDILLAVAKMLNVPPEEVSLSQALIKQGFDGTNFTALSAYIEKTYQIDLPPIVIMAHETLLHLSKDVSNKVKAVEAGQR